MEPCGKAFQPAQKYSTPFRARRDELRRHLGKFETPARNSRSVPRSIETPGLKKAPRKIFSFAILRFTPSYLERNKFSPPIKGLLPDETQNQAARAPRLVRLCKMLIFARILYGRRRVSCLSSALDKSAFPKT